MSVSIGKLLRKNKNWAKKTIGINPKYFKKISSCQNPKYLWIGCTDSRVCPNTILDIPLGEILVARNIANSAIPSDGSLTSVVNLATNFLKIKKIIVCGHYNCSGVELAFKIGRDNEKFDKKIDKWLKNIVEIYNKHKKELSSYADEQEAIDRLSELNVIHQAKNLKKISSIKNAKKIKIYTLIYDVKNGVLKKI